MASKGILKFFSLGCVNILYFRFFDAAIFVFTGNVLLKEETVEDGKTATAPDAPTLEGMEFVGWEQSGTFAILTTDEVNASPVTQDIMYKAQYKEDEVVTGMEGNEHETEGVQKIFRDGHFYILRNGELFTLDGQRIGR